MATVTTAGAKLFIGPANSTAASAGDFSALPYSEVGEVVDIPAFGDVASLVTTEPLNEGRVKKQKGNRNAGSMSITYDYDPADTGQTDLDAAEASTSQFAFRVTLNDAGTGSPSSPSTWYFRAFVMSTEIVITTANNMVRKRATLELNTKPIEVAPV